MKVFKILMTVFFMIPQISSFAGSQEHRIAFTEDGREFLLGYYGNSNGGKNINFVRFKGIKWEFKAVKDSEELFHIKAKENTNRNLCLAAFKDTTTNRNPLILTTCQNTNENDRSKTWKVEEDADTDEVRLVNYYKSTIGGKEINRYLVANLRTMEFVKLKETAEDADLIDFHLID